MQLFVERIKTPIGALLLTHDGSALANIAFADREERRAKELTRDFPDAEVKRATKFTNFAAALTRYFDGDIRAIDKLPVISFGTAFQKDCWAALRRMRPGTTRTYGDHARAIGWFARHGGGAVGRVGLNARAHATLNGACRKPRKRARPPRTGAAVSR